MIVKIIISIIVLIFIKLFIYNKFSYLCKIFGHRNICFMGFDSICSRCGLTYKEQESPKSEEED